MLRLILALAVLLPLTAHAEIIILDVLPGQWVGTCDGWHWTARTDSMIDYRFELDGQHTVVIPADTTYYLWLEFGPCSTFTAHLATAGVETLPGKHYLEDSVTGHRYLGTRRAGLPRLGTVAKAKRR